MHRLWVSLAIPYLPDVLPSIRALPGVQWNASHRIWEFPYSNDAYKAMKDGLLNQVDLVCQEADSQIVEWEAKEQSLAAHQRDVELKPMI